MDRSSVYQILFPELRSFPTDAARRSALEIATSARNAHGAISHVEVLGLTVVVPVALLLAMSDSHWVLWTIPVVAPLCVGTVLAFAYRARVRRSFRDLLGKLELCCRCGYNLTGNVSGRCPECGEAVALPADMGLD